MRHAYSYEVGNNVIVREEEEEDLEVVIQGDLSPDKHINNIFGDTYSMPRNIKKMPFHYLDKR